MAMVDQELPDGLSTVIQTVREARQYAERARRTRINQNRRNRDAYFARQDWSKKRSGQSKEFLPKTTSAVEQMGALIKRGLIQFGDWFTVSLGRDARQFVSEEQARKLLLCYLERLQDDNGQKVHFASRMAEAVKMGVLESLMVFKVHGHLVGERRFVAEPGEDGMDLVVDEQDVWRLRMDLVPLEDYYPDPTGRGLFEIHRVERDIHSVVDLAEQGIYDADVVDQLIGMSQQKEEDQKRLDEDRAQDRVTDPSFRKTVVLEEYWGTILNKDGTVAHENVVCTVANDRFLIRKPEPNPYWHQESPFVTGAMMKVPFSVWHRALMDQATDLNLALNEMFNLMLDGGLASVWGIKQVRLEDLEDPGQVAGGIQQGATLAVKASMPHNAKVVETVSEGEVPRDAMAIFEFLDREFKQAALTNEISLGSLPPKQVRATEVVEAQQSQAVMLDAIVSDLEVNVIAPLLRKAWLTIMQNADDLPGQDVIDALGPRAALFLSKLEPAQRFALFGTGCAFRVHGLSAVQAKVRDFQKIMALMQSVTVNPLLMQAFAEEFSGSKILRTLMKTLNLRPEDLQMTPEELQGQPQRMAQLPGFAQLTNQKANGGSGPGASETGDASLPAEINQATNPMTGMVG